MAKPQTAAEYGLELTVAARRACLEIALRLGSIADDLVVVGGLVPSLLIPQQGVVAPHVGTLDLDVGLSVALLDTGRYAEIADALRAGGFGPDENANGNPTFQRWQSGFGVTVDFLIPATRDVTQGGLLQNLTADFAAIVTPGLELAFRDRELALLDERFVEGERAIREIGVCGAGAFIVLKALAFGGRAEPKDAYDLHYVLSNYHGGPDEIARRIRRFGSGDSVTKAIEVMQRDFSEPDLVGPARVSMFLHKALDEELQADAAGAVRRLLRLLA